MTAASTSGDNPATGGCDPLHLSHAVSAIDDEPGPSELMVGDLGGSGPPRATLVCERYAGWYRSLTQAGSQLPSDTEHGGWRIDVTVAGIGHLGTFRRSGRSGRWFAGQHRWHELGIPDHPCGSAGRSATGPPVHPMYEAPAPSGRRVPVPVARHDRPSGRWRPPVRGTAATRELTI